MQLIDVLSETTGTILKGAPYLNYTIFRSMAQQCLFLLHAWLDTWIKFVKINKIG